MDFILSFKSSSILFMLGSLIDLHGRKKNIHDVSENRAQRKLDLFPLQDVILAGIFQGFCQVGGVFQTSCLLTSVRETNFFSLKNLKII